VYLGALGLAQAVVGLPLRWWSTFVIEARFGFNRTTPVTFWTDTAKGAALAVGLGGPLLAAVLWLFAAAGTSAWVWCWALATAWVVVVQYVAPTWLLPLFHRCTPLAEGPLRDAILAYAARVGFPLAGVTVIDGSRRSTKANAFFTGFGARKRIALFDTLLAALSADEVLAVLAHEVGHYRRRHVVVGMGLGIVQLGVTFALLALVLGAPAVMPALGVGAPSVHTALVAFALLSGLVDLPLGTALHALSRRHERQADAFAVETAGAGGALASALKTLAADSLSVPAPHPAYVALHHTHPPLAERVRALRA
jgi:STE24 endopeptidase